jgi:hypothetical protein
MTAAKRARSRSFGREWWPEISVGAFLVFLGVCGIFAGPNPGPVADIILAVGYSLSMMALGWWMGNRHRRLPMQATLDGVRQDVTAVRQDVGQIRESMSAAVEALAAPPPPPPGYGSHRKLKIVR